jgi:putative phosphoesterase
MAMSTEPQSKDVFLAGVISDTHGNLRPEVIKAFAEVDLIIHAGDIGKSEVLEDLQALAPVHAVRGNMDGGWALGLPATEVVEIGEVLLYVLHDADQLDLDPAAAGFSVVINGHTHQPSIAWRNGVLFLNPGSAGPFSSSGTVALLHIRGTSVDPQLVKL